MAEVMSLYEASGTAVSSDAQDFYSMDRVFNGDCSMNIFIVSLRTSFDTHRPVTSL